MSRKWICDECAKYYNDPDCVCMLTISNPTAAAPERCPWYVGHVTAEWRRVKKSNDEARKL